MTQHHAHEGAEAHTHQHEAPPVPMPATPPPAVGEPHFKSVIAAGSPMEEAVHDGAQRWFAREFVGGLIAVAQARGIPLDDFLADKVVLLSTRLAAAESEVEILRTQLTAIMQENQILHARIDDCPDCGQSDVTDVTATLPDGPASSDVPVQGDSVTNNGDHP